MTPSTQPAWVLTPTELRNWFDNIAITVLTQTPETKTFKLTNTRNDETIITVTMTRQSIGQSLIQFGGLAGNAVFDVTWPAATVTQGYLTMSYGRLMEKLVMMDLPARHYDQTAITEDLNACLFDSESKQDTRMVNALSQNVFKPLLARDPFPSAYTPEDIDHDYANYRDTLSDQYEMLCDEQAAILLTDLSDNFEWAERILRSGCRPTGNVQLYMATLRLLEQTNLLGASQNTKLIYQPTDKTLQALVDPDVCD